MKYVLFNPLANSGKAKDSLVKLEEILKDDYDVRSVLLTDVKELVSGLEKDDEIIVLGGDGTLNHFINDLGGKCPENNVYLWSGGTGNDFLNDINAKNNELTLINKYLVNLPYVIVKGEQRYFINGIGYGIDGFCCEEADKLRTKNKKKINYTTIAVKGLLYKFKRKTAKVEVDGHKFQFKNVFLAPTMKGRYFGGGMMITPNQDRLNENRTVTFATFSGKSKLLTLINFPKIFKGEHTKLKNFKTIEGKHIYVSFTEPCALQVDGETYLDVIEYEVFAK